MNRPYRLAIATDAHLVGGAERFLGYLVGSLSEDAQISVLSQDQVVGRHICSFNSSAELIRFRKSFRSARRALVSAHPDIVLINLQRFTANRAAWLAAISMQLPLVIVDHAPAQGLTVRGRIIQRLLTNPAGARVSIGMEAADRVERWGGLPPGSVRWIHNGVPPLLPCEVDTPNERPVVGLLGRLDELKGIDILLEACATLTNVEVRIAGEGPLRCQLKQQAEDLGMESRVTFVGFVEPSQFLCSIDVLAVPSWSEGLPLAILEAMHAGIPVVASAVGCIPEVIEDGVTGRLVPPGDAASLALAIESMLTAAELRRAIISNAQELAQRELTDSVMAQQYNELFLQVISGHRGDRT